LRANCGLGISIFIPQSKIVGREVTRVEKKGNALKDILVNIGIVLILAGSVASKEGSPAFLFIGLILLAAQTLEIKAVQPKKLVMAEIILSASVAIAAIAQLVVSRGFRAPQVFLIIIMLGALLVAVEAVRKYSES
jgi:hypothetical protein